MFPLIATVVGGALAPVQVGASPGFAQPQQTSPVMILMVVGGLGLIGGLIYLATRR